MRYILALVALLLVFGYTSNPEPCTTDGNCAVVWDDTSGSSY